MVLLLKKISQILLCQESQVRDRLNHPDHREMVTKELLGRMLRPTYKSRLGLQPTFVFGGISEQGAHEIPAYGNINRILNCSVTTHFYARHRIRLNFPYTQCVYDLIPGGSHRYFPLELVELIEPEEMNDFKYSRLNMVD
jgi:hypothetical protein